MLYKLKTPNFMIVLQEKKLPKVGVAGKLSLVGVVAVEFLFLSCVRRSGGLQSKGKGKKRNG